MDITAILIISTGVIWGLFDVWTIYKRGKPTSISAFIIRGSRQYPLAVLLFGILLGHLFWSMRTEDIYTDVKCVKVDNVE